MAFLNDTNLSNDWINGYLRTNYTEETQKYTVRDLIRDLLDSDLDSEIKVNGFNVNGINLNEDNVVNLISDNNDLSYRDAEEFASKLVCDNFFSTSPLKSIINEYEKYLGDTARALNADENVTRDDWEDLMGKTDADFDLI